MGRGICLELFSVLGVPTRDSVLKTKRSLDGGTEFMDDEGTKSVEDLEKGDFTCQKHGDGYIDICTIIAEGPIFKGKEIQREGAVCYRCMLEFYGQHVVPKK